MATRTLTPAAPRARRVRVGPPMDHADARGPDPGPRPTSRTAVLVVHGMGQQVKHANVELATEALRRAEARRHGSAAPEEVVARRVRLPDAGHVERAEVVLREGDDRHEVHVYEAYWADVTEGQVRLRDVFGFLVSAGWRGFVQGLRGYHRWAFGGWVRHRASILVSSIFLVLLALVLLLAYVNAVVLAAGAPALAELVRPTPETDPDEAFTAVGAWAVVVGLTLLVRRWLVQYVGDVAVYVSAHRVSRFAEMRARIRAAVRASARGVYGARDAAGKPLYDRVAVVGHSLGSVIAYDTLNHLIHEDATSPSPLDVARRTCLLLTFGSPLDKTAFVFSSHALDRSEIRGALAAATQPLLLTYDARPFPWVNVWSPMDVVSGPLGYYDARPPHPEHGVRNRLDLLALVPLYAHVQYWRTRRVWDTLRGAVTAPLPAPTAAPPPVPMTA